jgi:hypothetical protein
LVTVFWNRDRRLVTVQRCRRNLLVTAIRPKMPFIDGDCRTHRAERGMIETAVW